MEEMVTAYYEESHRMRISKLEVYGEYLRNQSVSDTWISCLLMRLILVSVPKEETAANKMQVILMRKTLEQQNEKIGSIFSLFSK